MSTQDAYEALKAERDSLADRLVETIYDRDRLLEHRHQALVDAAKATASLARVEAERDALRVKVTQLRELAADWEAGAHDRRLAIDTATTQYEKSVRSHRAAELGHCIRALQIVLSRP